MSESLHTRLLRVGFNLFPAYRASGGKITYIRHDQREVHIKLPLSWQTRNYVGTIFGGSMYAAVDPIHVVLLIPHLARSSPFGTKKRAFVSRNLDARHYSRAANSLTRS